MEQGTVKCHQCGVREAICVPVMVVPVKLWPFPLYLQFKGGLCNQCAYSFNINKWTDWDGSWYDLAGDTLRSYKKPAKNPFPDDPNFKWETFILNPQFEPAPREECRLKFWKMETLVAKGMTQKLTARGMATAMKRMRGKAK